MSANNRFTKDPDAVLDYTIDWSDWLATGDTISTSSWSVESGSGLTNDSDEKTTTTTTIWLSGGTVADDYYDVINTIVTDDGRTDERTLKIRVQER